VHIFCNWVSDEHTICFKHFAVQGSYLSQAGTRNKIQATSGTKILKKIKTPRDGHKYFLYPLYAHDCIPRIAFVLMELVPRSHLDAQAFTDNIGVH
jgi:hypothetical protein